MWKVLKREPLNPSNFMQVLSAAIRRAWEIVLMDLLVIIVEMKKKKNVHEYRARVAVEYILKNMDRIYRVR